MRDFIAKPWGRFVLIVVLALAAFGSWFVVRGPRGAEIATVLGFPVQVLALLVGVLALLVAVAAFLATREPPVPPPPGDQLSRWWLRAVVGWVGGHTRVVAGLFLVLSLVATGRFWVAPVRVLVAGCEHATELRVLTSPEQLKPAQVLAGRFQDSARRFGCALVHLYVYALPTTRAGTALAARWPDSELRDAGPRPDVWVADSAGVITQVRTGLARVGGGAITKDVTIAWSPIVLGVPAAYADTLPDRLSDHSWSELVQATLFPATGRLQWEVVRPDPASSPAGELGTALLYGGANQVDRQRARLIEQRLEGSLDHGKYPLGDSLDVLCRYRQRENPQPTAVVISEQALARFNSGDPPGDTCGQRDDQRIGDQLLAYYPSDTRSLDYHLVRFGWSAPVQDGAAAAFGDWLASPEGARALADVGLRSPGFTAGGLLTTRTGVLPDAAFPPGSVPADVLASVMAIQQAAQRRSRVLLALDSSGSMAAPVGAGQGSRFAAARSGILAALGLMGARDEFGLWIFPEGPASNKIRKTVPIGPRDDLVGTQPREQVTATALTDISPAGDTPLYRAITDGVAELRPNDETVSNALVVLTDDEDTTSGLTEEDVLNAVRDKGVRVSVVAVGGEVSCSAGVLEKVTRSTRGRCLDADPSSIEIKLTELSDSLWSKD